MNSPLPLKGSKRQRFSKALRHGLDLFQDVRQSSSSQSSLPSGDAATPPTDAMLPSYAQSTSPRSTTQLGPSQELDIPGQPSATSLRSPSAIPTPKASPPAASPRPMAANTLKGAGNLRLTGLETALCVLEKSTDAFPPLKGAVGGLIACLDIVQVMHRFQLTVANLDQTSR